MRWEQGSGVKLQMARQERKAAAWWAGIRADEGARRHGLVKRRRRNSRGAGYIGDDDAVAVERRRWARRGLGIAAASAERDGAGSVSGQRERDLSCSYGMNRGPGSTFTGLS